MLGKILEKIGLKRSEEGFFEGVGGSISHSSIESGGVFRRRFEYFVKDPDTYTAVMSLTSFIVGPGFHVSGDERAVELVNRFNRVVGMDQILFRAVCEMLWAGNSFWIRVYDGGRLTNLKHIPLTSITAIHRDDSRIVALEFETITGQVLKLDSESLVHFYLIKHGGEVLGSPINRPLTEPRMVYDPDRNAWYQIPSYYDIKWSMEWAMWRVLMKYPPRHIYRFPRIGGEAQREYAEKIKSMLPGEDIVTNQEVDVIQVKMDPRARFDAYIEYLDNKVTLGLMTSVLRLFTKPGFTEASAKEANRLQDNLISAIQRNVKRIVEREIYDPLLESHGLDPSKNPVRFNWGVPEKPRIELDDINRFYATPPHVEPALSRDEVRRMLRSLGFPIMAEERRVGGHASRPRVIEAQNSIIVQFIKPGEVDLESVKDLVLDSEKGVRLTLTDNSGSSRIAAITFDKGKWPRWSRKSVEKWLDENLQLIEEKICNRGRGMEVAE